MEPSGHRRTVEGEQSPPGAFVTTHWSVVLRAGLEPASPAAQEALESLCRAYLYPLYASVRRRGYGPEDAQDLTQAFFCRLLTQNSLRLADPARGRFRSFLLTALQNFVHTEWEKTRAQKRGGLHTIISLDAQDAEGRYLAEPAADLTPDKLFEKRWAATLLDRVMDGLKEECRVEGKGALFDALAPRLWGEADGEPYNAIAARLGLTPSLVGVTVHRLRARYRELLRQEVAHTVATPGDVDEELRHLANVMSEPG